MTQGDKDALSALDWLVAWCRENLSMAQGDDLRVAIVTAARRDLLPEPAAKLLEDRVTL